ncbi:MAG: hypothetical protein UR83_C0024G0015 [Candidatus Moranbacteria bacterium GW2011_GWF2_35_54]|nr:MAG: hypothetical protein UR83_C0024G0015 [Candidatus Moranbacteria bacterium GW2011_GWF2_35_54]
MDKKIRGYKYRVSGTHCASCELIIEKKLLELDFVKSVDASSPKEEVIIEYTGEKIEPQKLTVCFF